MQQLRLVPDSGADAHPPTPLGRTGVSLRGVPAQDLTAEELDAILELLRVAFNGGPGWFDFPVEPLDHLRWKLADHPGSVVAVMAEDETGKLVGFAAMWQRRWRVQGIDRTGRSGGELALDPSLQGRGLVMVGGRIALTWLISDFSLNFSSHPRLKNLRERMGAHELGAPMETLVRPISIRRFVRERGPERAGSSRTRIALELRAGRKPKPWVARWLEWQRRAVRNRMQYPKPHLAPPDYTLRTIEVFDDRFDALFEQVASNYDLIQVRDSQFLNWRYADPRAGGFTIRIAERGDELLGYAVTRVARGPADLADFVVVPGEPEVVHALLRDALQLARAGGSSALRTWLLRNHPYYELLRGLGFISVRGVVVPGFGPMTLDASELAFMEEPEALLHIMPGDSDHV